MKRQLVLSIACVAAAALLLVWGFGWEKPKDERPGAQYALVVEDDTGTFLMQLRKGMQAAAAEQGARLTLAGAMDAPEGWTAALLLVENPDAWLAAQSADMPPALIIGQDAAGQSCVMSDDEAAMRALLVRAEALAAGGAPVASRDEVTAAGGAPAADGDEAAAAGGMPTAGGDEAAATDDVPTASRDEPTAAGDVPTASRDEATATAASTASRDDLTAIAAPTPGGDDPATVATASTSILDEPPATAGNALLPSLALLLDADEDYRSAARERTAQGWAEGHNAILLDYAEGEPLQLPEGCRAVVATSRRATAALAALKRSGRYAGAVLGLDTGDRRAADLEIGAVTVMALDNPYAMGYQALSMARALSKGAKAQVLRVPMLLADRDNMYLPENVKQVFPLLQ